MTVLENTATALLSQVATNYSAYTFFNDLPSIATAMQIELTRKFDQQLSTIVESIQVTDVVLPDAFQNAIMASIEAQQNITRAQGTANQRREAADAAVAITTQTVSAEMY